MTGQHTEKYTIYDNFDKLDLSPVASMIVTDALTQVSTLVQQNVSNINFGNYVETNHPSDLSVSRPISFNSQNMATGYVPDMFRYITNNRFYITTDGSVFHTSVFKNNLSDAGVKDFFAKMVLGANIFYDKFFFNISLNKYTSIFGDAVRLYNNPFYTPGFNDDGTAQTEANYNASIQNYFVFENEILVDDFFKLAEYDPTSPGGPGNNIPTFATLGKPEKGAIEQYKLLVDDLFATDYKNFTSFLYLDGPSPMNATIGDAGLIRVQALKFLERLLYPYRTDTDRIPRHAYFVTDLKKSNSVNINTVYKTSPMANQDNVDLEWQLPNIHAYVSLVLNPPNTNDPSGQQFKYYENIVMLDKEGSLDIDYFSMNQYYMISAQSGPFPAGANIFSDEYAYYFKLLCHQTTVFGSNFHNIVDEVDEIGEGVLPLYNKITLPPEKSDMMKDLTNSEIDVFMSIISNYFSSSNSKILNGVHTFSLHDRKIDNVDISMCDLQILDLGKLDNINNLLYAPNNRYGYNTPFLIDYKYQASGIAQPLLEDIKHKILMYSAEKKLSYSQVKNGKRCYSEIMAFEVVKYGFENNEKVRLQSFFIPCHKDLAKDLIDSQVFYNKDYIYEVFSISLVIGNEYESELRLRNSIEVDGDDPYSSEPKAVFLHNSLTDVEYTVPSNSDPIAKIKEINLKRSAGMSIDDKLANDIFAEELEEIVSQLEISDLGTIIVKDPEREFRDFTPRVPSVEREKALLNEARPILVRAPYYNTLSLNRGEQETVANLNKPPLPPDISFQPFKDIDNKVLITLGVNYGEKLLTPVQIFPEDLDQIKKHLKSQKTSTINTPFDENLNSFLKPFRKLTLEYRTDDFEGTYKIWRTTTKPINWNVFYNSTPVEIDNRQTTAFEDNIIPNIDYYYFARFEDRLGNFSNPTEVFYVRMVKEGGFPPYLIVKTHKFSDARPKPVYEKNLKKYLKIRLADNTRQVYNADDINKIDFGYKKVSSDTELKKYKVRIISKKTGKKLDINIDFKKDISDQYLDKGIAVSLLPVPPPGEGSTIYEKAPDSVDKKKIEAKIKAYAKQTETSFPGGEIILPDND